MIFDTVATAPWQLGRFLGLSSVPPAEGATPRKNPLTLDPRADGNASNVDGTPAVASQHTDGARLVRFGCARGRRSSGTETARARVGRVVRKVLYEAVWQPAAEDAYEDRPQTPGRAQGPGGAAKAVTPAAPTAYRPPSMRGQTGIPGSTPSFRCVRCTSRPRLRSSVCTPSRTRTKKHKRRRHKRPCLLGTRLTSSRRAWRLHRLTACAVDLRVRLPAVPLGHPGDARRRTRGSDADGRRGVA